MGADLEYQCLGNNQYRVTIRIYRDCCGIAMSNSIQLQVLNTCTNTSSTVTLNQQPGSGTEVSQLCPSQLNQSVCNSGVQCPANPLGNPATYPGVRMHIYQGIITLNAQCNSWLLRWNECCRNNSINNIPNPGGTGTGIVAMINNTTNPATGQPYCNNSVTFSTLPVPFICINAPFTFFNGGVDADGDSLHYQLINPLNDLYNNINFNAGWSVNQPVRTNPPNSFQFNPATGQLEFTPGFIEVDVLAMRVSEYRNGVLVGYTMRDIQVTVLPCVVSTPNQQPISNLLNGNQVDSLKVQVCPGTPLQFDVMCIDPANHNLTISSNINANPPAIPGATLTQIGTGDTVIARIQWTPQASDTGCRNFSITAVNDDCPITGQQVKVYTICVFNKVQLLAASPTFCGTPVQLTATGGTNFTWSPVTGPNAVSNPNILNPTVSPATDQMYYFSSDCGTDSVLVKAAPPFLYDAGPGGTICQNAQLQLNAFVDNLYAPYKFKWVPPTGLYDPVSGLPNDTIINPVASPLTTTKYKLYVTGSNGCTNVDSLTVTVSGTGPNIVVKANPASVCPGDSVRLNIFTNPNSCGISQTPCTGNVLQKQIGTGTGSTPVGSPTGYPTVYGHYKNSARHQFLYLASEMLANGMFPSGGEIRAIAFNVTHINTANDTIRNFEIKMGCTSATSLNSWQPNLVTVFTPKNIAMGPTTNTGWKTHVLDYPYNWDGVSNLVIDICSHNPTGSALNAKMQMTPTTFNSVYYSTGNVSQCGNTGTPTTSVNRPDIKIDMCVTDVSGMPITWTPATGPNAPVPAINSVNPVATPLTPVIYKANVTAPNGCVSSDFKYVHVDTSLRFSAFPADTFLCNPTPVTITTHTVGAPLPGQQFTYQFRNLNTNTVIQNSTTNSLTVTPSVTTTYVVTLQGGACLLRDTVRVQVGTNIPITMQVDSIKCFGQTNGKIKAIPSGGSPPLQFIWSNGSTADSIINLGPALYSVTVQDAVGCSGSTTFNLPQPPQLTLNPVVQQVSCFGAGNGSITLNPSGGTPAYSVQWNPQQPPLLSINGLSPGTYHATVTDSRGCTVTTSQNIIQPAALSVNLSVVNVTINGASNGSASATVQGGVPPYSYVWSNGANTPSINNIPAGNYCVTVTDQFNCTSTACIVITEPPPLLLSFNTTHNVCYGQCVGSAGISVSGGVPPYTIMWSNGTSGNSINNLCAGSYQVTVTDNNGATVTGSVTINQPTQITVIVNTTNITCFGANNGSATAVVTGGAGNYSYQWSNGFSSAGISNLPPATYNVTVTDVNNCTVTASGIVTEPPQLTINVSAVVHVSCFGGNDGSATVNASGGTPAYQYQWSVIGNTGNANTASGFSAGPHSVTVTDQSACTASASFNIQQPPLLQVSVQSVANATCFGAANGAIDINVSGGTSPYQYLWSNTFTTPDLTGVGAGVYSLTVTDAEQCTATISATITQPTQILLSFTHTDPLCQGDANGSITVTATGGTPGYNYVWSSNPSWNSPTLTNVPAGTYTVVVADQNNCTASGSETITDPTTLTATFINKKEITCANAADGSITVTTSGGTPPYNYQWSHGAVQPNVSNMAPGNYTVTVSDNNLCSVSLSVSFIAPAPISVNYLAVDSASCPGYADGWIQISAIGGTPSPINGYSYSINGGSYQTSEFFYQLKAGSYQITIRDDNGCTFDTTVTVHEPQPLALDVYPTDSTIKLGASLTLHAQVSNYTAGDINTYVWSPPTGLSCTDCPVTIATPYSHTVYVLTVNYLQDCSVSRTVRVYVDEGNELFVPNAFSPNGDGNNDVFFVYGSGLAKAEVKIFNRWGELVFDTVNQWEGWDGTYKGVMQSPGVYAYHITATYLNGKEVQKNGSVLLLR
ncbi:MAG: gliding motility-associated C-terminal domain-containing protein [Chitinophagales bacterium]|nr:gliding motility-associated C-terminal domain-containing protein [Chitinophagales bacterium]